MPAAPGMNIKTDTPLVKKAREGVMEFMLVGSKACRARASPPSAAPLANALINRRGFLNSVIQGSIAVTIACEQA